MLDEVDLGRKSYAGRAWVDAYDRLARADAAAPLPADDLLRLAQSAFMLGRMEDFLQLVERTHNAYLDEGDVLAATRCTFYLGVNLAIRGELARASGWFGRGQRLVERHGEDCAERGYLQLPVAMGQLEAGQYAEAEAAAASAVECAERFRDPDLFESQYQSLLREVENIRLELT